MQKKRKDTFKKAVVGSSRLPSIHRWHSMVPYETDKMLIEVSESVILYASLPHCLLTLLEDIIHSDGE